MTTTDSIVLFSRNNAAHPIRIPALTTSAAIATNLHCEGTREAGTGWMAMSSGGETAPTTGFVVATFGGSSRVITTGATNRYPRVLTVSMYTVPGGSFSARRSAAT